MKRAKLVFIMFIVALFVLFSCSKDSTGPDNAKPGMPSNPNPENNATDVSLTTTISWDCIDPEGDPLTYDIYFGTSSNAPLINSGQSNTTYNLESLDYETTYYWKINAKDDEFETEGNIWAFTTSNPPILTLYVPNDYPTINSAMSVAEYGNVILVAPGIYNEHIIMEDGVTLVSESGPLETIISINGVSEIIRGAQDATINGFTISENDNGNNAGSGVYSDGDNITVCNCVIRDNHGGIYLNNSSQARIFNNTIDNNSLDGIFMQIEPEPVIYNNIISNHSRSGIYRNNANSLGNPIIKFNCYFNNDENYGYFGSSWYPEPGTGEIFEDPCFVGGNPYDYHLNEISPCIDSGDPNSPLDPDGTISDIGALYFHQN